MSVISKQLFYEKIAPDLKCYHLHNWSEKCVQSNLMLVRRVFVGSTKFFLPIYIIKAIINYKKLKDKRFWIEILSGQVRSGLYGMLLAIFLISANCLLCKLSGRLHYYNIGLISGFASGLSLLVETKENKILDALIFVNLLIEALLNNLNYFQILRLTKAKETVMFMTVSSLLMYLLQNREKGVNLTNFWFYTPPVLKKCPKTESKRGSKYQCVHKGICSQFAFKGLQKYFFLGYLFSIVRKIIPKMLSLMHSPSMLFKILINKDNLRFGAFIGSYVGLYRYIICYLVKTKDWDQKYFGAISGLISGATYLISPNLQVLTVGITTVLQTYYYFILKRLNIKNQYPQQLMYMISHCLLLHNAIMCRNTCPTYYINMLDTASGNLYSNLYNNLFPKYFC